MTERFQKAYDALVNAFFDGTLAKGTCKACAVGNIVGAACGATIKYNKRYGEFSSDKDNSF